jgi:hypothetical protein
VRPWIRYHKQVGLERTVSCRSIRDLRFCSESAIRFLLARSCCRYCSLAAAAASAAFFSASARPALLLLRSSYWPASPPFRSASLYRGAMHMNNRSC